MEENTKYWNRFEDAAKKVYGGVYEQHEWRAKGFTLFRQKLNLPVQEKFSLLKNGY